MADGATKETDFRMSAVSETSPQTSTAPRTHDVIFSAFELIASANPTAEDYLKAAELLDRVGAKPMDITGADKVSLWQSRAVDLDPALKNDIAVFRGRVKGPAYREFELLPGQSDVISEVFYAAELASISIKPNANAISLMVQEQDEDLDPVCDYGKVNTVALCEWTPMWTAPYDIRVTNHGVKPVSYLLISN